MCFVVVDVGQIVGVVGIIAVVVCGGVGVLLAVDFWCFVACVLHVFNVSVSLVACICC